MLDRILDAVHTAYPELKLCPAPARMRGRCAVYRYRPTSSAGSRKKTQLVIKFFGENLAEAMAMYNGVRGLILSDGDESRVGTGIAALNIEETAQDAAAGYVSKTGLYYVQAGFMITGY